MGQSRTDSALCLTPKSNRTERRLRVSLPQETKAQGREMIDPRSHSLAVEGLGLSHPWDIRMNSLS